MRSLLSLKNFAVSAYLPCKLATDKPLRFPTGLLPRRHKKAHMIHRGRLRHQRCKACSGLISTRVALENENVRVRCRF